MTELLGPADIPGNIGRLDPMKLFEERAKPQRRRHDVVRHAHAFSAQVSEAPNSGLAVCKQPEPYERLGGKDRQGAPLPPAAIAALFGDDQLGERHFENVELVIFEVSVEKL